MNAPTMPQRVDSCPHCGAYARRCEADVNTHGRDGRDDASKPADRRICAVTGVVLATY